MISIVIIVKNDKGIENTLSSLKSITYNDEFEIIVVDASKGSLDYIKRNNMDIVWIDYIKKDDFKKYTIPEQRNIGIEAAKGGTIVFIDANCIPENAWLTKLTYPLLYENEYITAGSTKSIGGETVNDRVSFINANKKYLEECPTINMAFKKEIIDKVGFFDENYDYGSDVDFSWRCWDKGFKVRNVPEAVISHDWGNTKNEMKRDFLYGQARARLYVKHKSRRKKIMAKDPVLPVYALYIMFLPITLVLPWYPLTIMLLVLKNAREKSPFNIVFKHLIYGIGGLYELYLLVLYKKERTKWLIT